MNLDRLYEILADTTIQLRKGEEIEGTPELVEAIQTGDNLDQLPGGTVSIYDMPHEVEAREDVEKVDCHFIVIGVDKAKAEQSREEVLTILEDWSTEPALEAGPSYIHAGAAIGDQGAAFQLFALGQTLGFWKVITPKTLGMPEPLASQMAGQGYVLISGFDPEPEAARARLHRAQDMHCGAIKMRDAADAELAQIREASHDAMQEFLVAQKAVDEESANEPASAEHKEGE